MKSPTKQDFIVENQEEEMEIQRKIKVKILDPDATESSSDDEQEKRPKLIVHEIVQEKVKIQSFSLKNKNPLDLNLFSGKLPPMVQKRKCGKFATEIRNPFNKKRIWLGTFDTAEEASQVYQSKKLEFEEKLNKAKNVIKVISAKSETGSSSRNPPLMVDSQTSDSSKVKTRFSLKNRNRLNFDQFSGKLPPMVRKRKSGKFVTEIRDPFSKKRIWLGTFNTAEEASQVYQSKKLEFEEKLKAAKSALVKNIISEKSELGPSSSSNPPLMVDSQNTDSSNEFEERMKKAKNAKVQRVISAKSEIGSSSSDPPLMVDSQTSDSSNGAEEKDGQESEEEMWMGQWVQISGDKEVKFSQKLGVPVVDNYGFLLGEFSKLDDLSISV